MSTVAPQDTVTALLRWGAGRPEDQQRLFAAVQAERRRIAAAYMRRERPDHTLQPTALVNEAYMRLVGQHDMRWENRAHLCGIAARAMRQILVDYARRHRTAKRGLGARAARSVTHVADPAAGLDLDVLALHAALDNLAELDPRQAEIVELRYLGGLTEEEVAKVKGLSPAGGYLDRGHRSRRGGALSPGGRWIAYTSAGELYVRAFPNGPRLQAATGVFCCPSWRADGRELYYQSRDGTLMAEAVRDGTAIDFGRAERLMAVPADSVGYWPSPDGQRFLVATPAGPAAAASPVTVVVNWASALRSGSP